MKGVGVTTLTLAWFVIMFLAPWAMDELTLGTMAMMVMHWFAAFVLIVAHLAWTSGDDGVWETRIVIAFVTTVGAIASAALQAVLPIALLAVPLIPIIWFLGHAALRQQERAWEEHFKTTQAFRGRLQSRSVAGAVFDPTARPSNRDEARGEDSRERFPATKAEVKSKLARQDVDPWSN